MDAVVKDVLKSQTKKSKNKKKTALTEETEQLRTDLQKLYKVIKVKQERELKIHEDVRKIHDLNQELDCMMKNTKFYGYLFTMITMVIVIFLRFKNQELITNMHNKQGWDV